MMNNIATIIVTDNPVIRYYVWMLDMMWQYWYVTVALCVVAVWIIGRYFARRQREWDEHMNREREKFGEFKRKVEDARHQRSGRNGLKYMSLEYAKTHLRTEVLGYTASEQKQIDNRIISACAQAEDWVMGYLNQTPEELSRRFGEIPLIVKHVTLIAAGRLINGDNLTIDMFDNTIKMYQKPNEL